MKRNNKGRQKWRLQNIFLRVKEVRKHAKELLDYAIKLLGYMHKLLRKYWDEVTATVNTDPVLTTGGPTPRNAVSEDKQELRLLKMKFCAMGPSALV